MKEKYFQSCVCKIAAIVSLHQYIHKSDTAEKKWRKAALDVWNVYSSVLYQRVNNLSLLDVYKHSPVYIVLNGKNIDMRIL